MPQLGLRVTHHRCFGRSADVVIHNLSARDALLSEPLAEVVVDEADIVNHFRYGYPTTGGPSHHARTKRQDRPRRPCPRAQLGRGHRPEAAGRDPSRRACRLLFRRPARLAAPGAAGLCIEATKFGVPRAWRLSDD